MTKHRSDQTRKLEIISSAEKIGLRKTEAIYGVTKKTIISWKKKLSNSSPDIELQLSNKSKSYDIDIFGFDINVLVTKANYYLEQNNFTKSSELYLKALNLATTNHNHFFQAVCLYKMGIITFNLNQNKEALNYYKKADAIVKHYNFIELNIKILGRIGNVYQKIQNYYAALKNYRQQFDLAIVNNYPVEYCTALSNISRLHYLNGENDKAIEDAKKCLPIAQRNNILSIINLLHSTLGLAFSSKNMHRKAEEHFYMQLEYAQKINKPILVALAYSSLGYCECLLNDFDLGHNKMELAYQICLKAQNNAGVIISLAVIAKSFVLTENYSKALFYYKRIFKIYENQKRTDISPAYYEYISLCYLKLKKLDLALEMALKFFDLVKFSDNRLHIALAYSKLGQVYLSLKQFSEAAFCFKEQLRLSKQLKNKFQIATAYSNLSALCSKQKKVQSAANYLDKSTLLIKDYQCDALLLTDLYEN